MGNSTSNNHHLRIYIETDKTFYNSGSVVKGAVFVEADEDFQFDALLLRIQGNQHCKWFEGSSKNRRRYLGDQNFYTVQHMLSKFDGNLTAGRYAYPFSIELSQNIPGTFHSRTYQAKIQYKLVAYFTNFRVSKHNQYQEIPLIIRQPFRQEISQLEGEVVKNPMYCCCFSAGQVAIRVNFQKNVCFVGESVKVEILADNSQGRENISSFSIKLIQYTFVSANNGANRTYQREISSEKLKGILKGDKTYEPIIHFFKIPEVNHQTAISTLVANYYRLQVSADVSWISIDEPTVYSPIFILKKSYDMKGQKSKKIKSSLEKYANIEKLQHFRAPDYWFRKNKNLSVFNFRYQDGMLPLSSQHEEYRSDN